MTFRRTALAFAAATLLAAAGCADPVSGLRALDEEIPDANRPAAEDEGEPAKARPSFQDAPNRPGKRTPAVPGLRPSRAPVPFDAGGVAVEIPIDGGSVVVARPGRPGEGAGSKQNGGEPTDDGSACRADVPDQPDFDGDGTPDACDPDADGDTIEDRADECPYTEASDSALDVPREGLAPNHFAMMNAGDVEFTVGLEPGREDEEKGSGVGFKDTMGCNCAQIIEELELGAGQGKFGCSRGVMNEWINLMGG